MSPVTPVGITELEAGVLARLAAKIDDYGVEAYPDKPETHKLRHQRGAFLVAYRGADYDAVEDTGDVVQTRRMLIDVVTECRQLSGHDGAYVMLELARVTLAGWRIAGFTKLSLVRERFLNRGEGVWLYAQTFATTTVAVELPDDEELGPVLERLRLESTYTISEIPTPP
ncbi:MAG: Gp37 family protein [Gemmatimonadaceae bacterium]